MIDDVENFMKSVELNPKVCNQKKYTNEETGQEITYIKAKKIIFYVFIAWRDIINFTN